MCLLLLLLFFFIVIFIRISAYYYVILTQLILSINILFFCNTNKTWLLKWLLYIRGSFMHRANVVIPFFLIVIILYYLSKRNNFCFIICVANCEKLSHENCKGKKRQNGHNKQKGRVTKVTIRSKIATLCDTK